MTFCTANKVLYLLITRTSIINYDIDNTIINFYDAQRMSQWPHTRVTDASRRPRNAQQVLSQHKLTVQNNRMLSGQRARTPRMPLKRHRLCYWLVITIGSPEHRAVAPSVGSATGGEDPVTSCSVTRTGGCHLTLRHGWGRGGNFVANNFNRLLENKHKKLISLIHHAHVVANAYFCVLWSIIADV